MDSSNARVQPKVVRMPEISGFSDLFRSRADLGPGGVLRMPFDRFMAQALYDPVFGYYRRNSKRVGHGGETDFFTATTSGPVFGELISAAAVKLLRERGADPKEHVFVEIGAEPGGGVLEGVSHPFAGVRTIRVGEAIAGNAALTGKCVVFSNELFDAQPFRRFVFREGAWCELGVMLDEASRELKECELEHGSDVNLPNWGSPLPGYHLDLPCASRDLAREIASQPWQGLFLACDYGKSWGELTTATPAGTARAYYRHTQSNDLLARPGEQDLTCHICWDWLAEALTENGFVSPQPKVESQESFFMNHAGEYLAKAFADDAARAAAPGTRKRALMQLLHPAHMGQKFQVLHALK